MKIRILGTAAGGGLPQWNCACDTCTRSRRDGIRRTQDCVAIAGDRDNWYLLNASPDLRTQLLHAPELTPGPGRRDTPLRGVLLTSAELDHTLGLTTLREAERLSVYATAPITTATRALTPLDHYTQVDWTTVTCGQPWHLPGGLTVTAIAIAGKRPRYAADQQEAPDWVIAYRITDDGTRRTFVYAPCLAEWTPAFTGAIQGAHLVLLDGTFLRQDEMVSLTGRTRSQGHMGHLPIEESLPLLARHPGPRYLYTHLNNTNPLSLPCEPLPPRHMAAGAGVATDGDLIDL